MKIVVFSDSHGAAELMLACAEKLCPDLIIHLGDCVRDTQLLKKRMPHTPLIGVRGNCDVELSVSERELLELEGHRLFVCHGHRYGVKLGTESLLTSVMCSGSDVVLYGHTHIPDYRHERGVLILNPGSIGRGRPGSFAVLELEQGKQATARLLTPQEL